MASQTSATKISTGFTSTLMSHRVVDFHLYPKQKASRHRLRYLNVPRQTH